MKKVVYILIVSSLIFSCKKKNVDSSENSDNKTEVVSDNEKAVLIQFSKSACYGKCPTYSATITEDGMIDYRGTANMPLIGDHKIKVRSSFASEILDKAKEIKYFELKDKYDNQYVTDVPSTTLSIQTDKRSKSTYARHDIPADLTNLNNYIHEEIYKMVELVGKSKNEPIQIKANPGKKMQKPEINERIK